MKLMALCTGEHRLQVLTADRGALPEICDVVLSGSRKSFPCTVDTAELDGISGLNGSLKGSTEIWCFWRHGSLLSL